MILKDDLIENIIGAGILSIITGVEFTDCVFHFEEIWQQTKGELLE